ncbi:3-hydroxyacyl-CoA dehydrogenase NAD-binding domain-containing protein [Rhodopila sp.]|jgi:3-hydroxyacyl-CoA dehydrogenase|uniref:3-hydroxyacyl-CoA dehydrogenase NAD-binding domain-containing protein n=1 Tax=Rhodopila sp. TaxID=2480087 RepID=UPI002CBD7A91|nr:3-hydroxyacyl-CoA dehydrogenase NAD-binding domain-containing protein [Rhodopila sp.]HVZ06539.1 3-hydroxyacyl-CoA dehydrogenase NAD-binding domain-containing protein [Rhodopila sp.]
MSDSPVVRLEKDGDVALVIVNYPPVNALGPGVSDGIVACLNQANTDPSVKAIVLMGDGRSFIAGADIRGFGTGRKRPPVGQRTYDVLDASPKPVVAAIHGYALGGGLENAMACHYRIAVPSAKVGLPEVLIGILPGGGGTQRLPRLAGAKTALEMITSGRHVPAPEAKALGILDEVLPEGADLRSSAVAYARKIANSRPLPRVRDKSVTADPAIFDAMRKSIARKARNQLAPYHCIAAVEAACTMDFDAGIRRENELFQELENSDEAKALRHAFFAEREVAKLPDLPNDVGPYDFKAPAVVGAGTMGGGIAMSFADFGYDVRIMDATQEALDRGMERIRANYATSVKRGSLGQEEMERRLARIHPVASYDDIKDCDVVVEAVFERMDVKKPVFARLDEVMRPDAFLFSNTSALDMDELAAVTKRPEKVAGTHFFSPANVMKLLEVVRPAQASPQTLRTAMALGRKIGKISAMAGNTDGFVANRSRAPFNSEMVILLEEGCLPEQVDKVMVDFGYPMGPFAVGDLAGLDIGAEGRKRRAAANPNYRKLPIADKLVEMGRYGQKTGAGWYRYEKGDRTPHPDPEVAAIIKQVAAEMGVPQKEFTDTEILQRLLFSSVNEACRILEEGKAYRASDVDVMWLHGFGFPRYRGGLMYWADGIGVRNVYNQILAWHQQYGDRWAPSKLLRELAETNTPFRQAKPAPFA